MKRPPLSTLLLPALLFVATASARGDDVARWREAVTGKDHKARLEAAYFPGLGGKHADALIAETRHKNATVRRYAATALSEIPPAERPATVIPALVALFSDPEQSVRDHATLALARIGEPAVPALIKVLQERGLDQDAARRWNPFDRLELREECAHVALIAIGPPAVPALVGLAGSRNNSWAVGPAAVAVARIGPPAVPALTRALKDPNRKVQRFAVLSLGALGREAASAAKELAAVAHSDDEDLAVDAGQALAALGPTGFALLLADVSGNDVVRRVSALRALGLGTPDDAQAEKAARELARGLTDADERIRYETARAAIGLVPRLEKWATEKDLVTALGKALGDKNLGTRVAAVAAAQAVTRLAGAEAVGLVPALTAALSDTDKQVVEGAARALGGIGPKAAPAAEHLAKKIIADDFDWPTRHAVAALVKIGSAKVVPDLLAALKKPGHFHALDALGQFPPEIVLPEVKKLLPDARDGYRRELVELVGRNARAAQDRGPFVTVLRDALAHDDSRFTAVAALAQLKADAEPAAGEVIAAVRKNARSTELLRQAGYIARSVKDKGPFVELFREFVKAGDTDPMARQTAVVAIQALRGLGPDAAPAVPELLAAVGSAHFANEAVLTLGPIGPKARAAVATLTDRARDKNREPRERGWAVQSLVRIAPADGWKAFTDSFEPDFDDRFTRAVVQLLVAAGPDGLAPLRAALEHPKSVVREAAARALEGTPAAAALIPELIAVADRNAAGRSAAIRALGRVGPPAKAAGPVLAKAVSSGDAGVSAAAVTALIQIGPEAEGRTVALVAGLSAAGDDAREEAARALLAASAVPEGSRRLVTAVARERHTREYLGDHQVRGRSLESLAAKLCKEYGGPRFLYPSRGRPGLDWPDDEGGSVSAPAPVPPGPKKDGPVDVSTSGGTEFTPPGRGGLPAIYWPPSNFDSRLELDRQTVAENNVWLSAVHGRLRSALAPDKFGSVRLYQVVHSTTYKEYGFALVCRPTVNGARLSASADPLDQIGALAQEREPGQLRIAALVVVRARALPPVGTPGVAIDVRQLEADLNTAGRTDLPESLAAQRFGEFNCYLMVHQYERAPDGSIVPSAGGGPAAARAVLRHLGPPYAEAPSK